MSAPINISEIDALVKSVSRLRTAALRQRQIAAWIQADAHDRRDERKAPHCRFEFEHAVVIAPWGGDSAWMGRRRDWGRLLEVRPLADDDSVLGRHSGFQLKPSSGVRRRDELRHGLRCLLGRRRRLVGQALRLSKKHFVLGISLDDWRATQRCTGMAPEEFWRVLHGTLPVPGQARARLGTQPRLEAPDQRLHREPALSA